MSLNFDRISTCSTKSGESARGPGGRGEGALRERERADREAPASAISGMMSDNGWKLYKSDQHHRFIKYYLTSKCSRIYIKFWTLGIFALICHLVRHRLWRSCSSTLPILLSGNLLQNISKYYRINLMPQFRNMYQPISRHLGSGHSAAWGSGSGVSGQDPSIALRFLSSIVILFTLHHLI